MPRLIFTVNDQMEQELRQVADERGMPIAALIREAVATYLASLGRPVQKNVDWGGKRADERDSGD